MRAGCKVFPLQLCDKIGSNIMLGVISLAHEVPAHLSLLFIFCIIHTTFLDFCLKISRGIIYAWIVNIFRGTVMYCSQCEHFTLLSNLEVILWYKF